MTLDLNVLNHLGLNLYSNLPAVVAEAVANSWDADAEGVWIDEKGDGTAISIRDDGGGMTAADVNRRYLTVGYQRRSEPGGGESPKRHRPVMGRKGIGKLSLFSVAKEIEVYTVRNGERSAFRMGIEKISEAISAGGEGTYFPEPILGAFPEDLGGNGTKIVLRRLTKELRGETFLRRRLARWFGVIGADHNFRVEINGNPVTLEDRGYWPLIEFIWHYGKRGDSCAALCTNTERKFGRPSVVKVGESEYPVEGWIATVRMPKTLRDEHDNLNRIVLLVRDKLAEDNLLDRSTEAGLFTKYLVGEIYADFLDLDGLVDIATTSRQRMIEDDPRYVALVEFVRSELRHVEGKWTELRNEEGTARAASYPEVRKWYERLEGKNRQRAQSLFGKINQLPVQSEDDRKTLIKHAVLAFEHLAYKERLDDLEAISLEDLAHFTEIIGQLDAIEASLYREIVFERLQVINKLKDAVDKDAKERVIQQHLFNHLWLLDPAWERATDPPPAMETSVKTAFGAVESALTEPQRRGRLDIYYKTVGGMHVIVELKRAHVSVTTDEIIGQLRKYRRALERVLADTNRKGLISCVVVLGSRPSDWAESPPGEEEGRRQLDAINTRVTTYTELIDGAYEGYKAFFDKATALGPLRTLITSLEPSVEPSEPRLSDQP